MIAAGWDYALIVEDDVFVDPFAWPDIRQLIERHATPDSYIRLPAKHWERPRQVIDAAGDAELILPRRIGLQAIAQVVGSAAAARLLAHTDRVDRPIDALLQMHWVTHQTMHALCTKGVQDVSHDFGGSTIQKKAPGGGRLSREWKRAFYRAQVAMRPQTAP